MVTINMSNIKEEYQMDFEIECSTCIAACITDEERDLLKKKWNENGGRATMPWYKWVLGNVHIALD